MPARRGTPIVVVVSGDVAGGGGAIGPEEPGANGMLPKARPPDAESRREAQPNLVEALLNVMKSLLALFEAFSTRRPTAPGFRAQASTGDLVREALADSPESTSSVIETTPADEPPGSATHGGLVTLDPSVAANEAFLRRMERVTEESDRSVELDAEALRTHDARVHTALLAAGILTVALAAVGIVLIFLGYAVVGVVSAAIAILPGAGTAILVAMAAMISRRRKELADTRREHTRVAELVQATLLITDPDLRAREMAALTADLRRRAIGPG